MLQTPVTRFAAEPPAPKPPARHLGPSDSDRTLHATLAQHPEHSHNADALAAWLNMSARSLHRQLKEEGASLQALKKDWNFYLAYNMLRIAAILQGIAKRVEDGTASSGQAKASGAGARPMAELAWLFAQRH